MGPQECAEMCDKDKSCEGFFATDKNCYIRNNGFWKQPDAKAMARREGNNAPNTPPAQEHMEPPKDHHARPASLRNGSDANNNDQGTGRMGTSVNPLAMGKNDDNAKRENEKMNRKDNGKKKDNKKKDNKESFENPDWVGYHSKDPLLGMRINSDNRQRLQTPTEYRKRMDQPPNFGKGSRMMAVDAGFASKESGNNSVAIACGNAGESTCAVRRPASLSSNADVPVTYDQFYRRR